MIQRTKQDTSFETFRQLVGHLYRGGSWGYYWAASEAKDARNQALDKGTIWFPVGPLPMLPLDYGEHGERHLYFGVHPTRTRGNGYQRAKWGERNIEAINCLFAEFDAKDFEYGKEEALGHIEGLSIQPHVIIDSGGGYHCYWLLVEPVLVDSEAAYERLKRIQYAWIDWTGADGDAKDMARVLRIPGTINYKAGYAPDYPSVTVIRATFSRSYRLAQLEAVLPPAPTKQERQTPRNRNYTLTDDLTQAARNLERLALWRCDEHDSWVNVGFALSELGAAGLQLWDDWSRKSAKYVEGECERRWRSIKPGKITLASLTYWANEDDPPPLQVNGNGRAHESLSAPAGVDLATGEILDEAETEEGEVNLLTFETSDEGNAEAVYALHGERFRFVPEWGWLYYAGTHWSTEGAEAALGFAVVETLRERRDQATAAEIEALAKFCKTNKGRVQACITMLEKHVMATTEEFDTATMLLNVANGVVDLRTGELLPHNPGQRFTYCVPTLYSREADHAAWLAFLATVTPSEAVAAYLQEAVGYSLTGETTEECLWYIWGPSRSGKGTFCSALLRLMGNPLAVQIDFNTFAAQKGNPDAQNFALAPLKPARMVFASESGQYDMLAGPKVKTITGGDDVRCCFKGRDHFSYRPQFKVWLSSNERPKANPDDSALWERAVKVIEFPHSFLGEEDKGLKYRLQAPDSLQGILRWAVEGAMRWASRPRAKGLQHPQEVIDATRRSRNELDTVQQWIDECCERDEAAFTSNALLQASYEAWCESHGHKARGGRGLGRALSNKGFALDKRVSSPGGPQVRGVAGLKISLAGANSDGW